jgi:hypothetical protein
MHPDHLYALARQHGAEGRARARPRPTAGGLRRVAAGPVLAAGHRLVRWGERLAPAPAARPLRPRA